MFEFYAIAWGWLLSRRDGQDTKCGNSQERAYAPTECRAVRHCNAFRLDER